MSGTKLARISQAASRAGKITLPNSGEVRPSPKADTDRNRAATDLKQADTDRKWADTDHNPADTDRK
jgi:hypothetical protein